jgi:23S rRNA (cytidine1920-2'-O)/16S rRNA (cytidine1409-2'-O)-methyltransferase
MNLLDALLERGLAPDERVARGLILSGRVLVDDRPITSTAANIAESNAIRVKGDIEGYVSRGVHKLLPAIERTHFDARDKICLDLGVSTGGFTQVLLKEAARRVYAVDVSYGVTAPEIRDDPRVVLLERTNVRNLTREHVPEPVERVVGDLSFISWKLVLPVVTPLLANQADLLLLVKPQFELPAELRETALDKGVVHAPAHQLAALLALEQCWADNGLAVRDVVPASITGAKGNQEYFVYLQWGTLPGSARPDYAAQAARAVQEVSGEG